MRQLRFVMTSVLAIVITVLAGGAASVAAQSDPVDGCEYFEETGHNLCSPFLAFWEANDGATTFGMPLTEAYDERSSDTHLVYTVQYFENVRIEYRPDNAGTPYEFILGRLGPEVLFYVDGIRWQELPKSNPDAEHYQAATGHAIASEFWDYSSSHGLDYGDDGVSFRESLGLFGYPISGVEAGPNTAGDVVQMQWFERARLELDASGAVIMSPLGVQMTTNEGQFSPRIQQEFDTNLNYWQQALNVPGIMAGVWVNGVGGWQNASGVADRDTLQPLTFDDHFRIGSITKTFTGTLILQLVEQGLMSLDDPVSMYFPDAPNGDNITITNLGRMESGIATYTFDPDFQQELFTNVEKEWDPYELVEIGFRNTEAGCPYAPESCFEPGTSWFYSNTNFTMLGMIVEMVSGMSYAEALQTMILDPLGLPNTYFGDGPEMPEPFTHGYTFQGLPDNATVSQESTFWNPSWGFGTGDLISTVGNLKDWGPALGNGTLLSSELQEFRTTLSPAGLGPLTEQHRYGFGIGWVEGWWGHEGSLPGYNTTVYYRPDIDATIVVAVNSDDVPFEGAMVPPARIMTFSLIDIGAREAPLGSFDPDIPYES